jgi:hypothetical protein
LLIFLLQIIPKRKFIELSGHGAETSTISLPGKPFPEL